jgi:hypothetical protein
MELTTNKLIIPLVALLLYREYTRTELKKPLKKLRDYDPEMVKIGLYIESKEHGRKAAPIIVGNHLDENPAYYDTQAYRKEYLEESKA